MFTAQVAFERSLGTLTPEEFKRLSAATVAIAGLGGAGGTHVEVLARLGIGGFHLADLDTFELSNFNRQMGATLETIGRPKLEVMTHHLLSINPEARVSGFSRGVQADNVHRFLDGVDVAVDGFDAFCTTQRRDFYKAARQKGIPVVAAGPLGFGATLLVFLPEGMSYDAYYGIKDGMSDLEQFSRFIVGTSPRPIHLKYLDLSYVDFSKRKGPSSVIGTSLCGSAVGTAVLNLLLHWRTVRAVPHYQQLDLREGRWLHGYLWGGNANPWQKLKLNIFKKRLALRLARRSGQAQGKGEKTMLKLDEKPKQKQTLVVKQQLCNQSTSPSQSRPLLTRLIEWILNISPCPPAY